MKRFGIARTLFFLTFLVFLAQPTCKVEAASIAVTVNDHIITKKDLTYRIKLALLSMNMPMTKANRDQIKDQVLDALIQEQLKLQLGEEFDLKADPQNLKAAVRNIERQNNMSEGGFKKMLAKNGIPFHVMESQLKAQLIWQAYIHGRYGSMVQVNDAEVQSALLDLKHGISENRYQLAEIVLYFDSPETKQKRTQEANRIIAQTKQGASFGILANQMSQAPSAASGGDIGFISESKLSPEIKAKIAATPEGRVTQPIIGQNSIRIYLVRDKLSPGQFAKPKTMVSFKQVFVPNPKDAFAFEIEDNIKQVASISKQITSCRVVEKLIKQKNGQVQFADNIPLQNLPGPVKDIISKTPVNRGSKPVYTGNGALFFVVCKKQTSNPKQPDEDTIRAQLVDQKLEKISEQEMRTRMGGAQIDRKS